ncbi:MAG: beta-ketoacyl-ACP synthase II, partial [candidate division WOR-3 bacterium]
MKRRVVITGLGAICCLGQDKETFWQNILKGKSGITRMTNIDTTNLKVKIGGEVRDFKPDQRFDPKEVRRMDRCVQFAMWATAEAIADAGLDFDKLDRTRVGVIIGSGIGGISIWEVEHVKFLQQGPARVSPLLIPMMISDMTSGMVSIHWGLKGPNYTTTSACASGAHAIGDSYRLIAYGDADLIISGGSEAPSTPFAVSGFANMRALSQRNDEPEKASRPFDRDRDGFVMSEGAGIVILEELEHALRRNARIYCEVVGYGMTGDGFHITAPAPEGEGAYRAMRRALEENNIP